MTRLAFQQNSLINSRRPVERVLSDPSLSDSTRKKLRLSREILKFADGRGLLVEDAYEYFIQLEGRSVSYIVQAAHPDRLESITTWFPIVGRVPYLGYFKAAERDVKAAEYRELGYDVAVGGVSAYSSLGWFDDPLYSSMLLRPDSELAHLLFHELTHRTLWIAGSTEFNENLAEFVAGILTHEWLETRKEPDELKRYTARRQDRELLRHWVGGLKKELEAFYKVADKSDSRTLISEKTKIFQKWQQMRPAFAVQDLIGDEPWNNATVLATSLYSPDMGRFEKVYQCVMTASHSQATPGTTGENLAKFFARIKSSAKIQPDPFKALDNLCPAMGR